MKETKRYLYGYKQKPGLFLTSICRPERAQMCIMRLGYTCVNVNILKLIRAHKVNMKKKGLPNMHEIIGEVTI